MYQSYVVVSAAKQRIAMGPRGWSCSDCPSFSCVLFTRLHFSSPTALPYIAAAISIDTPLATVITVAFGKSSVY